MNNLFSIFKKLAGLFRIIWPPTVIRIIIRGGQATAQFREEHDGRDPTEDEWKEIASRIRKEVLGE